MRPHPSPTARAVASSQNMIARLQAEKAMLIHAVLRLQRQDRAYWERALQEERDLLEDATKKLHDTTLLQAILTLQQLIRTRQEKIVKYEALVARAQASETDLEEMLVTCHQRQAETMNADVNALARELQGVKIQGNDK